MRSRRNLKEAIEAIARAFHAKRFDPYFVDTAIGRAVLAAMAALAKVQG
ncbi:hypothetical protein [Bosea sp. 117]|nr:hypothetical protein [Bosea sp. 117]